MAMINSSTSRKIPQRGRCSVRSRKKWSTTFSQDALVGVKYSESAGGVPATVAPSDVCAWRHIRQVIRESPSHGEGHRKIWARLRGRDIRSSKPRVLRLVREAPLPGPAHQAMVASHPNAGTILTEQPNQVWANGRDRDSHSERWTGDGVCRDRPLHGRMSRHPRGEAATRFEALESIRQAVKEVLGGFRANVAQNLKLRHEHGSQHMSNDFQKEIRFLGLWNRHQPSCDSRRATLTLHTTPLSDIPA
jgi:putative transposase